jgi:hypothetical protein
LERGLRIAPWGVILLALLGALGLASLLTGIVLSTQAQHSRHEARALSVELRQAVDSVAALSCKVR